MTEKSKTGARRAQLTLIAARLALATVFLVAAYAKLRPQANLPWSVGSVKVSLSMFAMQVDSYQILPPAAVSASAHLLPFIELALGLWLASGIFLRASSILTALLLGGFFALMVRTYALGLEINCGCFGPGEHLGAKTLIRDGSLLAFALAVAIGAFLIPMKGSESESSAGAAEMTPAR